jgi:hypothetical protein
VCGFAAFLDRSEQIEPKVFPLILRPTVVALKSGYAVGKAISHQLTERIVFGIKIGGGHGVKAEFYEEASQQVRGLRSAKMNKRALDVHRLDEREARRVCLLASPSSFCRRG